MAALGDPVNISFSARFEVTSEPEPDALAPLLATVDPATVAVLNEWLMQRPTPVFRMADSDYQLRWVARTDRQWQVLMELACGTNRAAIALEGLAAIDPLMVGEPFSLMPESLRTLAISRQLARATWNAPPAISHALEVHAVHWQPTRLPDWPCQLSFSLTRQLQGSTLRGVILFENVSALQWLHSSLPIDPASGRARLALELPLRLIVGRSSVASDELARLGAGDVVFIESAGVTREGVAVELLAPLARRGWHCRARRSTLQIVSVAHDAETSAADAPAAALRTEDGEPVMNAERLPLETPVTFDLGEINMKVQDLERLQPGQIVDLPQDITATTVALRVAGRRVAEGTLVAVGRRLGVRISRICIGPQIG